VLLDGFQDYNTSLTESECKLASKKCHLTPTTPRTGCSRSISILGYSPRAAERTRRNMRGTDISKGGSVTWSLFKLSGRGPKKILLANVKAYPMVSKVATRPIIPVHRPRASPR